MSNTKVYADNYGDILAQINNGECIEYYEVGSYQGEYVAIVKLDDQSNPITYDKITRYFVYIGSYGSCSGCDWLEAEGDWTDDSDKTYAIDYKVALDYVSDFKPFIISLEALTVDKVLKMLGTQKEED